jgi:integrase
MAWRIRRLRVYVGIGRARPPGHCVVADARSDQQAQRAASNSGRSLPAARPHDLRHIHATTLLRAGVPVHVMAVRLGHADPSITLRVYAHVVGEQLAEAAAIFARAVEAD